MLNYRIQHHCPLFHPVVRPRLLGEVAEERSVRPKTVNSPPMKDPDQLMLEELKKSIGMSVPDAITDPSLSASSAPTQDAATVERKPVASASAGLASGETPSASVARQPVAASVTDVERSSVAPPVADLSPASSSSGVNAQEFLPT